MKKLFKDLRMSILDKTSGIDINTGDFYRLLCAVSMIIIGIILLAGLAKTKGDTPIEYLQGTCFLYDINGNPVDIIMGSVSGTEVKVSNQLLSFTSDYSSPLSYVKLPDGREGYVEQANLSQLPNLPCVTEGVKMNQKSSFWVQTQNGLALHKGKDYDWSRIAVPVGTAIY